MEVLITARRLLKVGVKIELYSFHGILCILFESRGLTITVRCRHSGFQLSFAEMSFDFRTQYEWEIRLESEFALS